MNFDGIALSFVVGALSGVKGWVARSYLFTHSCGDVQATRAAPMLVGQENKLQFVSHTFLLEEGNTISPLRFLLYLQNEQVSRKIIVIGNVKYLYFRLQQKSI